MNARGVRQGAAAAQGQGPRRHRGRTGVGVGVREGELALATFSRPPSMALSGVGVVIVLWTSAWPMVVSTLLVLILAPPSGPGLCRGRS